VLSPKTKVVEAFCFLLEHVELTGGRRFTSGLVDGFNLLHGHRGTSDVNLSAITVFVVFAFPHQFGVKLRERMRVAWAVWSRCVAHSGGSPGCGLVLSKHGIGLRVGFDKTAEFGKLAIPCAGFQKFAVFMRPPPPRRAQTPRGS
jgi:hypothetical protein